MSVDGHGDCFYCARDLGPGSRDLYGGSPMCADCRRVYVVAWREAVAKSSLILKDAFPNPGESPGRDWFRGQMLNELKLREAPPMPGLTYRTTRTK